MLCAAPMASHHQTRLRRRTRPFQVEDRYSDTAHLKAVGAPLVRLEDGGLNPPQPQIRKPHQRLANGRQVQRGAVRPSEPPGSRFTYEASPLLPGPSNNKSRLGRSASVGCDQGEEPRQPSYGAGTGSRVVTPWTPGADWVRLGPRDQAGRLPPAGPPRRRHRSAVHAARLRLERPYPAIARTAAEFLPCARSFTIAGETLLVLTLSRLK
jgi:hypothetical protein